MDRPATVLVADDSTTVRRLVARIMERAGFQVLEAADGLDALTTIAAEHPDVAVLDHEMPGCTGLEVLLRITARNFTDRTAVLLLTGTAAADTAARALCAGADDFVRKPVDPAELVARVRRIVATKRHVEDLDRRSTTDALTGLLNRRGLEPVLHAVHRHAGAGTALLMVDIDHFKAINDTHGHAAGDLVLQAVAGRLAASAHPFTVARWGGEEFVVGGRGDDVRELERIAEGLRRAVQSVPIEFETDDGLSSVPVTVSVGAILVPDHVGLDEAMALADHALYEAKEGGRNRVAISPSSIGFGAEVT